MQSSTMKRIPSLEPFSRDHGVALVCVQQARKAVRASKGTQVELIEQIQSICHNAILGYLEDEQWILSPLIADDYLRKTFHERQNNIRKLTADLDQLDRSKHRGLGVVSMLADALDDYVRWEEHTLFPRIEEGMDREQLQHLSMLTNGLEAKRLRPTQQLHRSINAKPSERSSFVRDLLVIGLAAFAIKLIMSALEVWSTEWLRARIRNRR